MPLRYVRFVSLLCAALVCGLTLAHVLEMPGKRQLSGPEWLAIQHTFYGGFAIVGGTGELLGLASTALVAWCRRRERRAFALHALAVLGFLGMLLSYGFGNRPINAEIASWTATTLPPDWASYRDRWDAAHTVSAGLATVTLLALLGSIIGELPSRAEMPAAAHRAGQRAGAGDRHQPQSVPQST